MHASGLNWFFGGIGLDPRVFEMLVVRWNKYVVFYTWTSLVLGINGSME